MKSIAIIGGGLSGLAAGIFGQKAGFKTTIYEKNDFAGGCCFAWRRGDYTIDNCIHWLMGTKPGTKQHDFWKEMGGLEDDTEIHHRERFFTSELDGKSITMWRDPEKTRKEMLELSPEDETEINNFLNCVFTCQTVLDSAMGTFDLRAVLNDVSAEVSKAEIIKVLYRYMRMDLKTWSAKFRHPLLQKVILDFQPKEYEAFWFAMSYAMFTSGGADVPVGGSGGFTKRIAEYYESLGGEIVYGAEAVKVLFDEQEKSLLADTALGVKFKDGKEVSADYIVITCPLTYTFTKLLDKKYAPGSLERLEDHAKNPVYSAFHCAFAVDGEMPELDDLLYFPCDPFDVGCQIYDRIGVKNYRSFGEQIAPSGQTVIQCSFTQYPEDFVLWSGLRKNLSQYRLKKEYTAAAVQDRLEKRFPEYKGRFHLIDTWTPATYSRYINAPNGMYMRYITTPLSADALVSNDLPGVRNVFVAGHVLMYPGGTPMAAYSGKHVISRIENAEKTLFEKLPLPQINLFGKNNPDGDKNDT